jgi:hypothetical protein
VATGSGAADFAQKLEKKFTAGKPVRFVTDIVAASRISHVVIENLRFQDVAGKPARFAYVLSLRESVKPANPESSSTVDAGVAGDAKQLVSQLVTDATK